MRVLSDGQIHLLNTEQVADFALTLRYHFNGVTLAFMKHGAVRIRGYSADDALRIAQMLNRQHVSRSILDHLGIRVHARGPYLVAVANRDQLENMHMLHTLDKASEKIHAQGSQLLH